ncbi:MAG: hypothetical protein ACR2G3_06270 [Solirubrobacterales bacterium]
MALALAALLVALSMLAGSVLLYALGAVRPIWAEGAVGLAALSVVATLAVRLPGRAFTAAVILVVLLVLGSYNARRGFGPRHGGPSLGVGADLAGLAVLLATLGLAVVPFLLEGRAGVLGEGVYTNDHAAQLFWTEWLQNGFGPEPTAVAWGYPVGPQSLVAALAEVTGASLVDAFNGLLLAIPALTGLAALSLLGHLRPLSRVAAASLAGLPFLGASFLAQSAFKETVMALFVVGFTAVLALATQTAADGRPDLRRRAALGAAACLVLGGVFAYSVPALAWFGLIVAAWLAIAGWRGDRVDLGALRAALWRRRAPIGVALALIAGIAALSAGRIGGFVDRIGDVSASTGRLGSPIFPAEALGIWPEGDFRVVRGEVSGALAATAIAALALVAGALVLWRRRADAVLAALAATAAVYVGARMFSSIYVEAKALSVMAPLVVVVALGGLLGAGGRRAWALRILGVTFLLGAAVSTFLALRAAPVGFDDRGRELEQLAELAEGEKVVFLGVDRFGGYWLRGTRVRSPGGYVPAEIGARVEKTWQQGRAMDLDTLAASRLDGFDYAITTTAPYQSSPPSNMREVERTDSYVLWERTARTPRTQVLAEAGDPGRLLQAGEDIEGSIVCGSRDGPRDGGEAVVLPEPVLGGPRGWSRPTPFAAPGLARHELELAPGAWQLSLQYHSQVDLTLRAGGLAAELPASLVGMYLTHQGESSYWPVGEVEVPAGANPLEVEVQAAEPAGLADLAGAPRKVWLGHLAATRLDPLAAEPKTVPLKRACGRYVDRYVPR